MSAGDWFGTRTIAPGLRLFQPFEEARIFVRSLRLKNLAEWQQYCKGALPDYEAKPDDIPTNPSRNYQVQGWVSMGDWLGMGTIATRLQQYRSFNEARAFVRSLGLKSNTEWLKYCRGELAGYERKPDDIPARPDNGYRNKGWIGVGDWLGTGTISNRLRHYRQFNVARMFVHSLGLKNNTEWLKYCRGELAGYERKPDDIPATPKYAYQGYGWVSIGDWLGTGRIATHLRQYRPFEEARAFVRSLSLKSGTEWKQYCKGELAGYEAKPDDIPGKPERAFRDHGWIGIGDWLGFG